MQEQSFLEMLKTRHIVLRNYISRQEREGWPWIIFDKITQIVHRNWEKQAEGFSWKHTETPTGKVLYHMTTNHSLWVDSSPHFICIKSRAKIWHDTPLQQVCSRTEQKDSITCSKFVFNKEKKNHISIPQIAKIWQNLCAVKQKHVYSQQKLKRSLNCGANFLLNEAHML